ncbi:MAG: hypothetical protein HY822_13240 [Acidobacteria bacterium]|nr:hypothetical protein [Acidobacteriota bacterium]
MKLFTLLLAACAALAGEGRWKLQFFHDQDDSAFTLNDLKFASPKRGVACGFLTEKGRPRPTVLVTADGGETWSFVPTREVGLSLFFLNESAGWMVTPGGVWRTEEAGRGWRKLASLKGALRVYFLDERRGFAVGTSKSVWSTTDGGARWSRVEIPGEPKSDPAHTAYTWISFASPRDGIIVGASSPPRSGASRFPDWMDPQSAQRRRQWPSLNLVLETRDGGATWKASASSTFGQVSRMRFAAGRRGLALVEFHDAFEWPSEVFRIDTRTGKSDRVFRRKDRAVTDVLPLDEGPGFLASIEPAAVLRNVPIPGRLKMFESADLAAWNEMPADYRAAGRRAILASAGAGEIWVATDLGMILKLVRP